MLNKQFYQQNNIGKSKYVITLQDGIKTHSDGSLFWDIRIFKNQIKLKACVKELVKDGYKQLN